MKCANHSARLWPAAFVVLCFAFNSQVSEGQSAAEQAASLDARVPLLFEQNVGQTDSQVRYLARSGRYQIYLTQDAAVMKVAGKERDAVLRIALRNADENASIAGVDEQAGKTNYLLGSRSNWKTGVANFADVKYEGVYPGIDLKYYGRDRQLEYDFDVAPQADPSMIALTIEGADKITTGEDGSLVLETAAGEVRWQKPVAYQRSGTDRQSVGAAYLIDGNQISFKLGDYDHSKSLVIDPVLDYGTFLDGNNYERYSGFLVDAAGYAYIFGSTGSSNFPVTAGAYQTTYPTQNYSGEVFVTKLNQNGSGLVWSTFIGGTGPNNTSSPNGFTMDASGNLYIVGATGDFTTNDNNGTPSTTWYNSTFPVTAGAYNTAEVANWRYFLVKLNSTGSALDYSTFLSTVPNIIPYAVAVDAANNAYVTGYYSNTNGPTPFPATPGAYQSTYAGDQDAYIMKFNSTGTALDYATLVGGEYDEYAEQILVDSAGDATIDGSTYSPNYPITANGLRQTSEGGFITTLNPTGTGLLYSTVLNNVLNITVKRDAAGYYYAGGSAGTNLPVTANAFQKTFPSTSSGVHLGFLTEIDPSGNMVYSSYLAGNSDQYEFTLPQIVSPNSVTLAGDRAGDLTFPVTDRTYEQANCTFVATINTQASGADSLVYSGCTPINGTNNQTVDLFAGVGFFYWPTPYLDDHNNLYGIGSNGQTSARAFQKSPPNQTSGDGYYLWFGKYNLSKPGPGGVNMTTPWFAQPFPYGSPVLFEATGRSPQCSAGVAAMRVYTAPGVAAYTTNGATLDANIAFPAPDQNLYYFNPVIVVYDNCGKAFSLDLPTIMIQGPATNSQNPNVVSPTNGGVPTSPVHFVASATAPNCSAGIASMRIYTAPGVTAYTVNSSSLDTYLTMANGNYNTVIQAWDNCGNVYKTPISITVE
jgi:hypothetical protein